MRIKISKKESKESRYWLKLTEPKEKEKTEKNHICYLEFRNCLEFRN